MPGISHFNSPELPAPSGYSHASSGSGDLVFIGGQVGSDVSGRILNPGDMTEQFGVAIRNLGVALASAECRPDDVVKILYYVTDVEAYKAASKQIGKYYRAVFGHHYPASPLVGVKGLYDPQAMIEIEAVAVRS
jgi:enamine deaminase RidA (YjgF/YER057c/UK114 family)